MVIKEYISKKKIDLLFICPEIMEIELPELFMKSDLGFICIDEAHQIVENMRISY